MAGPAASHARRAARFTRPVFPSPGTLDATKVRDRRNGARALREVFAAAGMPWATPHTFRRTVAFLLNLAGVSIAEVADYLGHADPSMTARVYLGRRQRSSRAAAVL
jgi:integrase